MWVDLNGARGILIREGGETRSAVSVTYDEDGIVREILIVRNPDKLLHLDGVQIH